MSDFLLQLSGNPNVRRMVKNLGLPILFFHFVCQYILKSYRQIHIYNFQRKPMNLLNFSSRCFPRVFQQ